MKNLFGILIFTSLATAGFGQDPLIRGDDYIQPRVNKCSQNKSDAKASKDMNNTMDMNSPLYMNNGTLGEQNFNRNSDFNSNPANFYSRDMNIQTSENSDLCQTNRGATINNAGQKSKKGISNGWVKVKHNKLTRHLFNQPSNV